MSSEGGPGPDQFRLDIQGLRGIAVLLVVAYHAGTPITGGFVGVDVFFVVSGYVITRMLLREVQRSGRVRFGRFYLRRIRRLLPALGFMLVVTLLLSIALAPIGAQQITARTGAAAAMINANTYLIQADVDGGYFGVDAAANALIHTWSLSVEEQFYLVFPALLAAAGLLAARLRRNPESVIRAVLGVIVAISLTLSVALTAGWLDPGGLGLEIAFYSAPTRAWEFAAGGILATSVAATARFGRRRLPRDATAAVGLGLLALAALAFDEGTPFPGSAAIVPVLGSMLVIAAGEGHPDGSVARALGWQPLRVLGDVSYSWYLWHWPLIVFAAALWPGSTVATIIAAVVSLGPAWFSYRLVENPIRFRPSPRTRRTIGLGALSASAPIVAAFVLSFAYVQLTQTDLWVPFRKHADVERGCDSLVPVGERSSTCRWSAEDAAGVAALIGDSNAGQFTEGFVAAANAAGLDALVATRSACPFVDLGVVDRDNGSDPVACRGFVERSTADLVATAPDVVVIAGASDFYIERSRYELRSPDGSAVYRTPDEKAAAWEAGLRRTIERLSAAGIKVIIATPVPRLPGGWAPIEMAPLRLSRPSLYDVSSDRAAALRWRARAVAAETAAADGNAVILDTFDDLCPSDRCLAREGTAWIFRDSEHISIEASLRLTDRFSEVLAPAAAAAL